MKLELEDSDYKKGTVSGNYTNSSAYILAIDELHRQFVDGKVDIISLFDYQGDREAEIPIWYEVIDNTTMYGRPIINSCRFFTSHYVGTFSSNNVKIIIRPRFGNGIISYLIGYASNLYLPLGKSDVDKSSENPYWLIALLWRSMLSKALTEGQIPRNYIRETKNIRHFRGRLDLSKHIHTNLTDASRFFCTYSKLSIDNTINRTIRYTMEILREKSVDAIIGEFTNYDKRLEALGVKLCKVYPQEIDSIKYNKLNAIYKGVMNLSRLIISNHQMQSTSQLCNTGLSYFIDIAELWEVYLLKLLQRNLPECHVYSPNALGGEHLLENGFREIRPDIVIEKDKEVVMIIDAKYKFYQQFGKTAGEGVQREDLYQMTSYLYHYGREDKQIAGIFTAPVNDTMQMFAFSSKKNHRIGLINMNIADKKTIEQVHKAEALYINSIRKLL